MLELIYGPAKSGKSREILRRIVEASQEKDADILLLVPEQFSFETEKHLFLQLGSEQFKRVTVSSFTHLASEIFARYGGAAGNYANDSAKLALMASAIDELADTLEVYAKSAAHRSFAVTMLDAVAEFKNAALTPASLNACADSMEECTLRQKLKETSLIYASYQALLEQSYLDPLDDLMRAASLAQDHCYFEGKTVFFDEFKGFTAGEYQLLKLMLAQGKQMTGALCMDQNRHTSSKTGLFSPVEQVAERLIRYARESGVRVLAPQKLTDTYYPAAPLAHLERQLFSASPERYPGEQNAIRATLCADSYAEVDYTLAAIRHLVREEGYRYREIAVISRSLEEILPQLENGLQKYAIPYYTDRRSNVANEPLMRFVCALLSLASSGMSGENVLALLKCGMTRFEDTRIAELENYIYVWNITGSGWDVPFCGNPRGYAETFGEEDAAALARINAIREEVSTHVGNFRAAVRDTNVRGICTALVDLLEAWKIRQTVGETADALESGGEAELAREYRQVWEMLLELLDTVVHAIGERKMEIRRFTELFDLLISELSMGTLPQSVDTLLIGSADRIRLGEKRAVFVLGMNENEFPRMPSESGIFTDRERERLLFMELDFAKPAREKILEERFIVYKTLTAPLERLEITAHQSDVTGTEHMPSSVFGEVARMFDCGQFADTLPGEYYCETPRAAFSVLSRVFADDTALSASLKEALAGKEGYGEKVAALTRMMEKRSFSIRDEQRAKELFGREMQISPTQAESFYQCRFRYFLAHGLRIAPLRRAQLDPLETGNLLHKVLYEVTRRCDLKENYEEALIRRTIAEQLDVYIEQVLGGVENKTKRFLYLYRRMRESIFRMIEQMHKELVQSRFTPTDFELEIRADSAVPPLLLTDASGAKVRVFGKIDRVDTYVNSRGEKYVRIVDYKSGKKTFRLSDVVYGISLQMLIYQYCIAKNGRERYADSLPAGILYMPASEKAPTLPREADAAQSERQSEREYTMNGLLLEDREVLEAMDPSLCGLFIPISVKKDGDFTAASKNALVSAAELSKIHAYLEKLLRNMSEELHAGSIAACPLEGSCDYCEYRSICGGAEQVTQPETFSKEAALAAMEEEAE